jgi:hypothetical protein
MKRQSESISLKEDAGLFKGQTDGNCSKITILKKCTEKMKDGIDKVTPCL